MQNRGHWGRPQSLKQTRREECLMKKRLSLLATVFLTACSLGLLSAIPAYAAGGVNWQVKVKNPTKWVCHVGVGTASIENSRWLEIPSGSEATAGTGALCPNGLKGFCVISAYPYKELHLQSTDMNGTPMPVPLGGASCWNHSIKICKKRGDDANPQDGDYSFCKD
jgi:hypothetical protein